ncbi:hypothetical protein J1N35_030492 [Gossypium stocksii]|uniref:Uncharacterized protein n=1 Tax=Gossypium stocksii TaxID=47602 RepID=A0A9D3UZC3_9ROSI|nr:hypothetical protein J1N35_030492 [Gossypium stocksii]
MQEHRSSDAKKAVATPLTNHTPTPSSFPHAAGGEPRVADDEGLTLLGRRLKKPELLLLVLVVVLEVVGAAMNLAVKALKLKVNHRKERGFGVELKVSPMSY